MLRTKEFLNAPMRASVALIATVLCLGPGLAAREMPPSFQAGLGDGADIVVKSVRLTDNGDNDGFADPNETVSLYVTLRNSSAADRDGIVVTVASTDPTVDCIPSPVVAFGSLLAGQERESTVPAVFHVANVSRSDPFASLTASFEFQVSGNDFGRTIRPQQVVLDLDLNASGGLIPTTYTEGFEGAGFGTFTTMSLDGNIATVTASDGYRCQYNDPDFATSDSYGNTFCFLGFANGADNAYDWHVHTTSSPEGGRAYLGSNSLHWGVHPGGASADTTRLKQLDAIRTLNTVNLGWNGVTSVLSFKHQIGLVDSDYVGSAYDAVDRGIVQVQLAGSSGAAVGTWRKIYPYENVYDTRATATYSNCMFDPTDDGSTEDDYFEPTNPYRTFGPSSTCGPEFVFSRVGDTLWSASFDATHIGHASDGPGLLGSLGPGTWVQSRFDLSRYRGRRVRLRFLATTIEVNNAVTQQQAVLWNPGSRAAADDGWYVDDVQVTNTLTSAATVSVDQADRSGLPACGPGCESVAASITASPPTVGSGEEVTLDASGSVADQCPGGTLLYRFWEDSQKDGFFSVGQDGAIQEWSANAIATRTAGHTAHEYVDVRCSTRPACSGRAFVVVPFVCPIADRDPFPRTITWVSKTEVSWQDNIGISDAILGDLDALRAAQGQFNGTVLGCVANDASTSSGFTHAAVPAPGTAFYYLVKTFISLCSSWGTGSPAEVPGAGGDRDLDLAYDPHVCPSFF